MTILRERILQLFCLLLLVTSCSKNVFEGSSTLATDDSLLIDAKKAINAFDYQTAIDIVTLKMSAAGQTQVSSKEVLSSAYAGKCGLNFVLYLDSLLQSTTGTGFALMMKPFAAKAVDPASCLTALNTLQTIGPTAQRTANENAFAAVVGMSLIGSQIRSSVDLLPTNGDGTVDGNVCTMSDTEIDNVILGMGHMIQNFSYLTVGQLGSSSQTEINNIIAVCAVIPAVGSCSITDPTQITPLLRDTIRDLLNTDDYGVGNVHTAGNVVAIVGACP